MQCEVLAFKPVKKGRIAIVQACGKPDLIGEIPCAEGFTGAVGTVGTIRPQVVSRDGRIEIIPFLSN